MNGQEVALPFASADLSIRRASSSFLLLQAFGAHVLWGLELPAAYITLQPGFAGKVRPSALLVPPGRALAAGRCPQGPRGEEPGCGRGPNGRL